MNTGFLPTEQMLTLYNLGVIGMMAVVLHLIPRLTRPDLYFAVTVPPNFRDTPEGHAILRRYRVQLWAHSLIALGLTFPWIKHFQGLRLGFFWQAIGSLIAFLWARQRVMPHAVAPTTIREAQLEPRPTRLPGGWTLQLGPFAVLATVALYLRLHWEQIPARFPVHWGLDGRPNRWATRSLSGVYGTLLLAAGICAGLILMAYAILHSSRRVRVSGSWGNSETHFRHTVLSVLLGSEYFLVLVSSWIGLFPLEGHPQGPSGVSVIRLLTLVLVVVTVYVTARMGQGGTRQASLAERSSDKPETGLPVGDRTLDRYWKVGIFYINRSDPAIFVEKRFGIGYTLNFGHPVSWLSIALAVLVLLGLAHVVGK